MDLNGEQLQRVLTGPKSIDFGAINVFSCVQKSFHVHNDLNQAISVRLESDNKELSQINGKQQVIPAGKTAGFEIIFRSNEEQQFSGHVRYIVNKQYEFLFQVTAEVNPVKLTLEKEVVKLSFNDESQDLFCSEIIRVFNNGTFLFH